MSLYGARKALLSGSRNRWVLKGDGVRADVDLDFANNRGWRGRLGAPSSFVTCTRAISGTGHTYDYADDTNGVWYPFLANVPRITNKGLLVEEQRTNVVFWNRDLTNAAWNTKTNVTVALDQTGIDGATNSASSVTATNSNAIITQAITLGSSARFQTAFVKRISGSGTISMTMDGGSTWTAVTVTNSWSRVTIPTQTLANPTVGFKITSSGDAIAVDAVQNENSSSFATSPIFTTSTAVTRNADVVYSTISVGTAYSYCVRANTGVWGARDAAACTINDNSTNNYIGWAYFQSVTDGRLRCISGGTSSASVSTGTPSVGSDFVVGQAIDASSTYGALNGVASAVDSSVTLPVSPNRVSIGSLVSVSHLGGYIKRVTVWTNSKISSAELQRLTT